MYILYLIEFKRRQKLCKWRWKKLRQGENNCIQYPQDFYGMSSDRYSLQG